MVNDKLHKTTKTTHHKRNSQKITATDLFCRLVKTEFATECVKELKFHNKRRWRFDYAIEEWRIAIEVEGGVFTNGRHTRSLGFLGDMEKYNTATIMGWMVLRTTPNQLLSGDTLSMIKDAILQRKKQESCE